jgi:hypothetical protein
VATVNAINATCLAIRHVLETAAEADNLGVDLHIRVYGPADFRGDTNNAITTGVSIFLYRVLPNLNHRTPAGRLEPDGARHRTQLPLDLHILLTAWATLPETENMIVGWMMRTLEDYPTLPASVLNSGVAGTFRPDESVELVIGEMPGEEVLHLWEVLGERIYHISIPYVARAVFIESDLIQSRGEPVQTRTLDMRALETAR